MPSSAPPIAVRAVEAWLLADRERIANLLAVSQAKIPLRPEELEDPKQTLVDLARRSRRRTVRDGLVPTKTSGRQVGRDYNELLTDFVVNKWRPSDAARRSDSLRRALACLRTLA